MAGPTFQRSRTRANCRCGEPCYWCGNPVGDRHDHDHFPLPARHGGQYTVPSCTRCHSLKDRYPLTRWAPAAHEALLAGMSMPAQYAVGMFAGVMRGDDVEIDDIPATAALVVELVDACTTPEARIGVAIAFNTALDAERQRSADA